MAHAMQPGGLSVAEAAWRRQAGTPSVSGAAAPLQLPTAMAPAALLGRRWAPNGPGSRSLGVGGWALPAALGRTSTGRSSAVGAVAPGGSRVGMRWGRGVGFGASVAAAARRRGGGGDGGGAVAVAEPVVTERIEDTELYDETYNSYLAYAMSVIVSRAIPDIRDGLKPVHRRILYAMHELGLVHNKPFKKCARVVGEVLGKFHPHGDTAVYDSLVRMAQPFAMRQPLVDGHGNFGSLDDDPAAAMRYTECRLTRAAAESLLRDLGPDTVDWQPTFDESQLEPLVLPAVIPNLLVNGSSGIAVGLASNLPPHNLGEVVAALRTLITDPGVTTEQLLKHVRGPDFPTGGEVLVGPELLQAYTTGRGSVVVRGKAHIERLGGGGGGAGDQEAAAAGRGRRRAVAASAAAGDSEEGPAGGSGGGGGGREQVVITELPYQVFKSDLVSAIAELIEGKQLEGAADVRDESDRSGVRVVVEVKRGHSGEAVLAQLYRSTKLQVNFNYNCMALLQTRPRLMGLKEMLTAFLEFRCEVVRRRSAAALRSAAQRLHLVEGFLALLREPGRLDGVVADVRAADDGPAARAALVARHGLSEEQAEAILGLTLRRLTGLEAGKLEAERGELTASISRLQEILADRSALLGVVEAEAAALAAAYPDPRRTALVAAEDLPALPAPEDLLPVRPCLLLASRRGFLKRLPDESLTAQNRNTRGKSGVRLRSGDSLAALAACAERDLLLLITPDGKMHKTRAANVPASASSASSVSQSSGPGAGGAVAGGGPSGSSVANVLRIPQSFPIAALVPVPPALMSPTSPPRASRRGGAAAAAKSAADGGVDGTSGVEGDVAGPPPTAEAADAESLEEGEEELEEEEDENGEGAAAASARGPCLVLCSRRGLIKRMQLRNRRDRVKGITVMSFGSGANSAGVAAAAADSAAAADGAADATPGKRRRRARSAGGGAATDPEELGWAALSCSPRDVVALVTAEGRALLFPASDLRVSGPHSAGTQGIRISSRRPNDRLADMALLPEDMAAILTRGSASEGRGRGFGAAAADVAGDGADGGEDEEDEEDTEAAELEGDLSSASQQQQEGQQAEAPREPVGPCLLLVTAHGIGKRIPLGQLRLGTRRQSGVLAIRVATAERARKSRGKGAAGGGGAAGVVAAAAATRGSDRVVAALAVRDGEEVIMASRNGVVVRQSIDGIAVQGRKTRGTFVMQLDDGDEVAGVVVAAAEPPPPPVASAAATVSAAAPARRSGGRGRGRGRAV